MGSRGSARRAASLIGLAVAVMLLAAPAALGSTPFIDIHSAGPLSDIYIGNDLGCQVRSGGFSSTEFYPNASGPGDCGTFLNTGSDSFQTELLGPDFGNHAGGTHTSFPNGETPFTPVSQSFTGSGTSASPYQVTTVVEATDPPDTTGRSAVLQFTEVDSYVVGDDFYRTDLTVSNIGPVSMNALGQLYHVADCQLRGSDDGFGVAEPSSSPDMVACTTTVINAPPLEEFVPITSGDNWMEASATASPTIWSDLNGAFTNTCSPSCRISSDNAMGIEWPLPGLGVGQSATFSFSTTIVDTLPAGGFSFNGTTGNTVGGTVATVTDPNTSATASAYFATINWGDGTSSAGVITGGSGAFDVAGNHAYATAGTFPISVTITAVGTSQGSSTVTDSATITAPPTLAVTGSPTVSSTGSDFTGAVDPNGLATTAFFQYGLDPKYSGGGPLVYSNSTPTQSIGSDFTSHSVSASVTGLVPNALYHVRLVATNADGTTFGPDMKFTTTSEPAPGSPALGKTFNVSLVSGLVMVKIHGVFVPLTELTQIPANTEINALHGSIKLVTAITGGSHLAREAAAKGKKKAPKTQTGTFAGAIFKITQAHGGLATLALVENAFKGAPSYALCTKPKAGDTSAAALSSRTLQLLHASAHGKFSTKGRYSAATVRGTKWTIGDRCDGTRVHDLTDSVVVTDFVTHKTIVLHAGQTYLAKAPTHK